MALEWACRTDPALAARLASDLRLFWLVSGRLTEGRRWLDRVLGLLSPDDVLRGPACLAAGVRATLQDDPEEAASQLDGALAASRVSGDRRLEGAALAYAGALLVGADRLDEALEHAEHALAIGVAEGQYEPRVLGLSLAAVVAAVRGDVDRERSLYLERLAVVRARGDARRIAETLNNLAEIALAEGRTDEAAQLVAEALEIARSVARLVTRDVLVTTGRVALEQRRSEDAGRHLREALDLSVDLGQGFETAQCLAALAAVAAEEGDAASAARLFGAARRLRDQAGLSAVELEPDLESRRAALVDRLGTSAFDALASGGAGMDREAVLRLASGGPQAASVPMR